MITIEKLCSKNMDKFNELIEENHKLNIYNENFYMYYNNKSFIIKFFVKKMVKLFKLENEYIGYLWMESPSNRNVKLYDFYIKEKYMNKFSPDILKIVNSSTVIFDCFNNDYYTRLLRRTGFTKYRITYLMKYSNHNNNLNIDKNITFKNYNKNTDAKLRCRLQNAIFHESNRVPLTVDDIHFDEKQEYFLDDLGAFMYYKNKPIGYGQVIYSRNLYTIVNFGLIPKYRGRGFGKFLLCKLIESCKNKNINDIYIRVDMTNNSAISLYSKCGFENIGQFSSWIWSKNLIR